MPIVHFDTVTKQFSSDSFGVKDVSFSVEPGELIFVTGPSGSGKTTLMRLLLKEYSPTQGEIFFNGLPISDIRSSKVHLHRRKIGTVFQDYKLISELNVWENIAMPLYVMGQKQDAVERRVTDLLNLIKLPHKAELFPSQLSGGEAQRVGIARSLASGPELIMADEPTGNLDSETAHSIIRLFQKINELGTTIIIATHDQAVLKTFEKNRRIHLEFGELKSDTNHKKPAAPVQKKTAPPEEKHQEIEEKEEVVADKEKLEELPEHEKAHSRLPWWKRWFTRAPRTETSAPQQEDISVTEQPSETPKETQADASENDQLAAAFEDATETEKETRSSTDSSKKTAKSRTSTSTKHKK